MRGTVVASRRRVSTEIGRDRHGEALGDPLAGFAAEGEGNVALNVDEALGAAGGGLHDPRQAFGEGAPRAAALSA